MATGLLLCYSTSGFSITKICSNLPFNDNWEIDPLSERQRCWLIGEVFPQEYYYLSSGTHCYAFISADRKYVLKFFRVKSLSPKGWWKGESNSFLSEHVFANYKNAYDTLRTETGLLYIHLNRTREFRMPITLIDVKGKKHLVDLDTLEFTLQKKAVPIFKHLGSLAKSHQEEAFRDAVQSFLQMVAIRCEKGFASRNVSLHDHFGYIGKQPIQFDCGILTRDLSMKYPLNIQREILQAAERLDIWAHEHHPETSFIIQEEAERIIQQVF
jgi:hypothetical protein